MRFTNLTRTVLIIATTAFTAHPASAHTRLKAGGAIPARSTNPGIKTGPCGGLPRVTPAVLTGGQQVTIAWEETIQHPGHFEIYFSAANDANFQLVKMIPDDQDNPATLPHQFSTTITVPNTPCTACTIQLIQVMTEDPANPRNYYSCGDVMIQSSTSPSTPVPATPTPTPGPTPVGATPTPGLVATPTPSPTTTPGLTPVNDGCH